MTDQEIGLFFQTCIAEVSVSIAPLAVFLIEESVGFLTDITVLKRHTATLTDQISRSAEKSQIKTKTLGKSGK